MNQSYFYLTITGDGDAYDLQSKYHLDEFVAYNQGEYDALAQFLEYQTMCLRYPFDKGDDDLLKVLLRHRVGRLLKLPANLKMTVYAVCRTMADNFVQEIFIDDFLIRKMALLKADLVISGQIYYPSLKFGCIHTVVNQDLLKQATDMSVIQKAYFYVKSYHHKLNDIAEKLGFCHNGSSHNYDDVGKNNRPYHFSLFRYEVVDDNLENAIMALAEFLYPFKNNLLRLGDEIDVEYGVIISGTMPDEYQVNINRDTLHQFAQMRLSLGINLYFLNSY